MIINILFRAVTNINIVNKMLFSGIQLIIMRGGWRSSSLEFTLRPTVGPGLPVFIITIVMFTTLTVCLYTLARYGSEL